MSLESIITHDSNEGMSPAAFEAFKEKVRKGAAQMAAAKKKEKKFKKKETDLAHILVKFIKTSKKKRLVTLISRVLEKEVPANFVLQVILIGNEEIQEELFITKNKTTDKNDMVFFTKNGKIPLDIRIELDSWLKNILISLEEKTQKINTSVYGDDKKPIQEVLELTVYVLDEYLNTNTSTINKSINRTKLANFMLSMAFDHAQNIIKTHFKK